jgi:hypothetical protein
VPESRHNNRNVDGLELSPVLIGEPTTCLQLARFASWEADFRHTNHGHHVGEELIELYKTSRGPLSHTQGAWLPIRARSTSAREWAFSWKFSLDKVDDWDVLAEV